MSDTPRQIAAIDERHLALLRANVSRFLARCAADYDRDGLRVLDIAPQIHEGARAHFVRAVIETLDIDPASEATYVADICRNNAGLIAPGRFDLVVCTEVLEHTLNPFAAVEEIRRILGAGGLVLVTVPFNFRIHGPLPDCWRISEHGLRALFSSARGFNIDALEALEDENRFLMPVHYTLIGRAL